MIHLVPMTADHLDAVHRIETAVSPDPWSRELFGSELDDGGLDRTWLVAVDDDQVIGFCGLLFVVDEAHVMNVAVTPQFQRRGLAAAMVARLILDAGDRGTTAVTLEVRASNQPALALYRRFGFEDAGRRPRYYADGEDAVIMWLHNIHRPPVQRRLETLAQRNRSTPC